jgi:hypothetical protein
MNWITILMAFRVPRLTAQFCRAMFGQHGKHLYFDDFRAKFGSFLDYCILNFDLMTDLLGHRADFRR